MAKAAFGSVKKAILGQVEGFSLPQREVAEIRKHGESTPTVLCHFNPSEFTVSQDLSKSYKEKPLPPTNATNNPFPELEFTGVTARSMKADLFFDAYEVSIENNGSTSASGLIASIKSLRSKAPANPLAPAKTEPDLQKILNTLWELTEPVVAAGTAAVPSTTEERAARMRKEKLAIDKGYSVNYSIPEKPGKPSPIIKPPLVDFIWGENTFGPAYITSLSVRYIMFAPNGAPLRAVASVTFTGTNDLKKKMHQNPTSEALPGYTRRQVVQGDSLSQIAYQEYGDSTVWRVIAEANQIEDPLDLKPGQILKIP